MSATVLALEDEREWEHWDDVVEGERLMAASFLQRARGLAAVWTAAKAADREDFVSCEVAAALCVDDRTAQRLVEEAKMLVELPPLVEAIGSGRLRLPHTRVLLEEVLPVETVVALEVLAAVLPKVEDRTPAQLRGIVRRAIIKVDARCGGQAAPRGRPRASGLREV